MALGSNLAIISVLTLVCFISGAETQTYVEMNTGDHDWTLPSSPPQEMRNTEDLLTLKRGPRSFRKKFYAGLISQLRKLSGKEMVNLNGRLRMETPASTWRNGFGGIRLLKRSDGEINTGEEATVQPLRKF